MPRRVTSHEFQTRPKPGSPPLHLPLRRYYLSVAATPATVKDSHRGDDEPPIYRYPSEDGNRMVGRKTLDGLIIRDLRVFYLPFLCFSFPPPPIPIYGVAVCIGGEDVVRGGGVVRWGGDKGPPLSPRPSPPSTTVGLRQICGGDMTRYDTIRYDSVGIYGYCR